MGSTGGAMDFEGNGDYLRGLVGVETRGCSTAGGLCGFVDLDAGYQYQTWDNDEAMDRERHHGLILGPSFGLDAGGEHTRFRLALELRGYHHTGEYPNSTDTEANWQLSAGLVATVVYRL